MAAMEAKKEYDILKREIQNLRATIDHHLPTLPLEMGVDERSDQVTQQRINRLQTRQEELQKPFRCSWDFSKIDVSEMKKQLKEQVIVV